MTRVRGWTKTAAALAALATMAAGDSPTVPPRVVAYNFFAEGFGLPIIYRWSDGAEIGVYVVPTTDPEREGLLEAAFRDGAAALNRCRSRRPVARPLRAASPGRRSASKRASPSRKSPRPTIRCAPSTAIRSSRASTARTAST